MSIEGKESRAEITYRCAKCGLESGIQEAFVIKKNILGRKKTICFECDQKGTIRNLALQIGFLLVVGLWLTISQPGSWAGQLFLLFLSAFVIAIPVLLPHGMAQSSVGALLGFQLFAVELGIGNVVRTGHVLGVKYTLRAVPLGSIFLLAGPESAHFRLRRFLTILAGPAIDALGACGLLLLLPLFLVFHPSFIWVGLYAITFGVLVSQLIVNLIPVEGMSAVGTSGSEGWLLLRLPQMPEKEVQMHYALYYVLQAHRACDQGDVASAREWTEKGLALYPENLFVWNMSGYIFQLAGRFEQARQADLHVLESDGVPAGLKYTSMNNVAYANLMLEDPALLEQADDFSAQAVKNSPWNPSLLGTRGAVLVELGQVEAGVELLKSALKKSTEKRSKAANACGIALGELKRGKRAEAQKYLDAARQFDPDCILLGHVARKMETGA